MTLTEALATLDTADRELIATPEAKQARALVAAILTPNRRTIEAKLTDPTQPVPTFVTVAAKNLLDAIDRWGLIERGEVIDAA